MLKASMDLEFPNRVINRPLRASAREISWRSCHNPITVRFSHLLARCPKYDGYGMIQLKRLGRANIPTWIAGQPDRQLLDYFNEVRSNN
jgi:hypothetical protein